MSWLSELSWWSKLWLAFVPVFLFFGCQSLVNGEVHEAVTSFTFLGFFVSMFILDRRDVEPVGRSARAWGYWAFTALVFAASAVIGLITGMWMLAGLVLLVSLIVEDSIVKRFRGSAGSSEDLT
jgi:hypothetical protein